MAADQLIRSFLMIVAADAGAPPGDNPLADRREDREAAAERERKAKVANVASQSTNAIAAVRAQSIWNS